MQTVSELLRELRQHRGLTLSVLAEAVGSTKSYLSMIENNRVGKPPSDELLGLLEEALGVTDRRLRRAGDWARAPAGVRDQVQRLADDAARGQKLARYLQEAAKSSRGQGKDLDGLYRSGQLRRMIERTLGKAEDGHEAAGLPAEKLPLFRVPLVNKVTAGYPCGFSDLDYPARVADDYVSCPGLDDPDAFAATVVGESMMPSYLEGDIVVFSPAADIADGNDCFVRLEPDHETTFKRVYFDEGGAIVRLQPLNPKFAPAVHPREQVAGLYRAVWRFARL